MCSPSVFGLGIDHRCVIQYCIHMSTSAAQKSARSETRRQVAGAFREILSDPDFGASLNGTFVRRLQKSVRSAKKGKSRDLTEFLND